MAYDKKRKDGEIEDPAENEDRHDRSVTVDEEAKDEEVTFDENSANLVETFMETKAGKKALQEIAATVTENVEESLDATTEYRQQMSADWSIFTGKLPEKDFPYKGAANCHLPVMLENVTRICFRVYAEAFPDWNNVCGVAALGPDDEEVAQLIALHSNWQLRQQIPDFKRQVFRGLFMFGIHGDTTCHSWFDPDRRQNRHEFLTADEFVVPYNYTDTSPDYSNSPYRCRILPKQKHELERMRDVWSNVDEVIDRSKPSWDDAPEQVLMQDAAADKGVETTDSSAPYKLYWYEGWLKLPGQDRERFCKVILDKETAHILELSVLEYPNWQDQQRFDAQVKELDEYRSQKSFFDEQQSSQAQAITEMQTQVDDVAPEMAPDQAAIAQGSLDEANQLHMTLQPPMPPAWVMNPDDPTELPEEVRKEPVHLFTHFVLIEPIVGNLGLGYGTMQADFNRGADTAFNQAIDAATMGNCGAMVVSDRIRFDEKGGKIEIRPGAMLRATGTAGEDLKDNILPLKFDGANPQMFDISEKLMQVAQSSMQSSPILSGEPGKSGETFRGVAARIEQATKQTSVFGRKFLDGIEWVLKNNGFLNSIHLQDEEIFHVAVKQGQRNKLEEKKIGRSLYVRNYLFEIRADLRFVTQSQRIQEADELLMMAHNTPQLQGNIALEWQLLAGAFRARGREDLVDFLGPAPPPPPTALGMPPPPPPGMMPMQGPNGPPQGNGPPHRPMPRPQGGPQSIPGPKPEAS